MAVSFVSGATGSNQSATSVTTCDVTGVPAPATGNYLYVLTSSCRTNINISSVSGGGMTWLESYTMCGARAQCKSHMYYAYGNGGGGGGTFTVTLTLNSGVKAIAAVVGWYAGVDSTTPKEDSIGQNTLGEAGACSGGSDNAAPTVTVGNSAVGACLVVGTCPRRAEISVADGDFTQVGTIETTLGTSDDIRAYQHYQLRPSTTGDNTFNVTINSSSDWSCTAFSLLPAAGGASVIPVVQAYYRRRHE